MMELALQFTHAAAHVLWVGALVALAVFAVERLFIRTAAGRHAVHLLGLMLTTLVLPIAFFLGPVKAERKRVETGAKRENGSVLDIDNLLTDHRLMIHHSTDFRPA